VSEDKLSGAASVKVTPEQRYNPALPGLGVKIRQNPAPGEYRYMQFAWKKQGGQRICLQLNHDGQWGPVPSNSPLKFRYDAGPAAGEAYGAAVRVDGNLPGNWVVVTRDLFADFGEFTMTGLALSPMDGDFALFDHIYLGRVPRDFDLAAQQ
jgi:biopolymer transport protein ExbB